MRHALGLTIAAAALGGCSKQEAQEPVPVTPQPVPAPRVEVEPALKPDDVVVAVGDTQLLRADLELEVDARFATLSKQVPPERHSQIKSNLRRSASEQFVMKSLLAAEARKRGIEVTDEDEAVEYEKIKSSLPPGKTLEEVMATSPMGEERMRAEVTTGILVNKLFAQKFGGDIEVSAEDVAALRAERGEQLRMPETVAASHILLKIPDGADDAAKAALKKQATELRQQLVNGADFAEAAREHSTCPSSKRGGDLGTFRRGQMVKAFEEAAFSQEPGTIGEVIETRFGYHIIRVAERNDAGAIPDDRLTEMIRRQKDQQRRADYMKSLKADANVTYGRLE